MRIHTFLSPSALFTVTLLSHGLILLLNFSELQVYCGRLPKTCCNVSECIFDMRFSPNCFREKLSRLYDHCGWLRLEVQYAQLFLFFSLPLLMQIRYNNSNTSEYKK